MKTQPKTHLTTYLLTLFCAAATSLVPCQLAVSAANTAELEAESGIALYEGKNFARAAHSLEKFLNNHPDDIRARYYYALSLQASGQYSAARHQYSRLVRTNPESSFGELAKQGLTLLHQHQGQILPTPPQNQDPAYMAGLFNGQVTPSMRKEPRKVLFFFADWCKYCKEFEPRFEEARKQYKDRIQFERIDGEDPGNFEAKHKYDIKAYPSLVYLDGTGKFFKTCQRDSFEQTVKKLYEN